MMAANDPTPYDTAEVFFGSLPSWVASRFDKLRLASYDLYDAIYKNVDKTFMLVARGTEQNPVYIPTGKSIVEACNRYLAVDFNYSISVNGSSDGPQVAEARGAFDALMRSNKFWSRFTTQKRYGLVRGDALWHILWWNNKLLVQELDPRSYFPITDINDVDEVVGCHIVKRMQDPADPNTMVVRRQTYRYNDNGTVQSAMDWYALDKWDDRVNPANLQPFQQNVMPLAKKPQREQPFDLALPAQITRLPVYHIKNNRAPMDPFGVSELSGIERIIAAITQAISDQELALALDGLGLYATDSGAPVDENGEETNWVLGPGRVVELNPNAKFTRVNGVGSVSPIIDHLNWLIKQMRETTATSDVAVGVVSSVQSVQSGIALALQMMPLLAKNAEKETDMLAEYDLMFNDLAQMWMPAYGIYTPPQGLDIVPTVGDPMPVDRDSTIKEVITLFEANLITALEAQSILKEKLGLEFKFSSPDDLLKQAQELAALRDPFAKRLADEIGTDPEGDNTNAGATATPPAPKAAITQGGA